MDRLETIRNGIGNLFCFILCFRLGTGRYQPTVKMSMHETNDAYVPLDI